MTTPAAETAPVPPAADRHPLDELKEIVTTPGARVVVVAGTGVSYLITGRNRLALWRDLLNHGLGHPRVQEFCRNPKRPKNAARYAKALATLARADDGEGVASEYIDVAQLIFDGFRSTSGGRRSTSDEYRAWLEETVGALKQDPPAPPAHDLLTALRLFLEREFLIATTNYDDLLAEGLGLGQVVTWRDMVGVRGVVQNRHKAVLHIHGHYKDPASVVLGHGTYGEIVGNKPFQSVLDSLGIASVLVFIGCNAGLSDPNIGAFLRDMGTTYRQGNRHFIVARGDKEAGPLRQKFPPETGFRVIDFTETHSDVDGRTALGLFLRDLLASGEPLPDAPQFGRESFVAEVVEALEYHRTVALTGERGLGKTLVATAVADQVRHRNVARTPDAAPVSEKAYPTDVAWVTVGASDAASLAEIIADKLNLGPRPQQERSQVLQDYLEKRTLLLVVDGCDGAGRAAEATGLARLLGDADQFPGVRLLFTGRDWPADESAVPLHVVPLPPLACPAPSPGLENFGDSPAARLFLHVVNRGGDAFLTVPAKRAMMRIGRSLGGRPYLIEMAAGTARVPPAGQSVGSFVVDIADFLEECEKDAGTPPGVADVARLIDRYLETADRTALTRLSLFEGWAMGGAEAVCVGPGLSLDALVRALGRLQDKLLVEVVSGKTVALERFRLPDLVRDYLRDVVPEEPGLRERYDRYYLRVAEALAQDLPGSDEQATLERLDTERGNMTAVQGHQIATGNKVGALRMVRALWRYWEMRGLCAAGSATIEGALGMPDAGLRPDEFRGLRADALDALGRLRMACGDFSGAHRRFQEALTIRLRVGDRGDTADTLANLGRVEHRRGHFPEAGTFLARSLARRERVGEPSAIASTRNHLGTLRRDEGNYEDAVLQHTGAVDAYRRMGHRRGLADALSHLGEDHAVQFTRRKPGTFFADAERFYRESLALRLALNAPADQAWSLLNLGHLDRWQGCLCREAGDREGARQFFDDALGKYAESLAIQTRIGDRRGEGYSRSDFGLAMLLLTELQPDQRLREEARQEIQLSLNIREYIGDRPGQIRALEVAAQFARSQSRPDDARWLFEAALALRRRIKFDPPPVDAEFDYGRSRDELRAAPEAPRLAAIQTDALFTEAIARAHAAVRE